MTYNSRIKTICGGGVRGLFYNVIEERLHTTVIFSSALFSVFWVQPQTLQHRRTLSSEETVHALDSLAAIINALRPNALAASIVEPAVLGSSHRLAVQFALADGHTVIKVDDRAHVF